MESMPDFVYGSFFGFCEGAGIVECVFLEEESYFVAGFEEVAVADVGRITLAG